MKHFISSLFFASLFTFVMAQQPGIYEHGIYDDFSSEEEYTDYNGGLHWWGDDGSSGNFNAILTRDHLNKELDVVLSQGLNEYESFGLSFGEQNTIDFSPDMSYELIVENKSDSTLIIWLELQDFEGNTISTDAPYENDAESNAWKYSISMKLYPQSSNTLKIGTQNSSGTLEGILSGSFEDGYQVTYGGICSDVCRDQNVNISKTAGFLITVFNANNTGYTEGSNTPLFAPYPLDEIDISIKSFKVGLNTITDTKQVIATPNFSFPNPVTSDRLKLDQVVQYAALYDMTGQAVRSTTQSNEIDLVGLKKGLYILQTEKGSTKLILE